MIALEKVVSHHRVRPHRFHYLGHFFIQIDEFSLFKSGNFARPLSISCVISKYVISVPIVPGNWRHHHRNSTFLFCFDNVLAQIPSISMHHLMLASEHVVNFFCLFANPFESPSCPEIIVNRSGIIMSKLHQYIIAGL